MTDGVVSTKYIDLHAGDVHNRVKRTLCLPDMRAVHKDTRQCCE